MRANEQWVKAELEVPSESVCTAIRHARVHLGTSRLFVYILPLCTMPGGRSGAVRRMAADMAQDLRNHGHSPHAEPHTYAAMATDIDAFLRKTELRNVNLLGHSMYGHTTNNSC